MTDDTDVDRAPTPRPDQAAIIESDAYPMRVLAGAGTGKTYTMVRKIQHLVEADVPPDRILALTFTNNAANAMREKLAAAVGPRGYDIEAYTYHAICHELLQEFAYHADLDPRYEIATEADKFAIVTDCLDDVPYRFTNPDVYDDLPYATGAHDRLLNFIPAMKRSGITPADLEAFLVSPGRLLELEALTEDIDDLADHHLRVGWQTIDRDRLQELHTRVAQFADAVADLRAPLATAGVEGGVRAYLSAMIDTCEALGAFFDGNEAAICDGDLEDAYKVPGHLFGQYSNAPKGIPSVGFTLPGNLESFITQCQFLSDLTPGYRAYERRLDEEALLDFDDLVLETLALLEDDQVHQWVTDRYEYVFCDEFQDTDTVQFDLVRRIVTDDELFVVGDDDQAIYEWRGANVRNIGPRFATAYPNVTDKTLEENFRSRQPILDLANNALEHLAGRGSDKELVAHGDARTAERGVVTITAAEEPDDEAVQLRNVITRLLDGDAPPVDEAYAPGDIAILVRKSKHARPLVDELSAAGIPYELVGDLAAESVGVGTVIAYLKALVEPADEVSLNRILTMRYRLCESDLARLNTAGEGQSDADEAQASTLRDALFALPLDDFEEPDRVERAREDLSYLLEIKDTHSLSRLYRELKDTTNIHWFLSDQEQRDLATLEEIVGSFEQGAVQPELSPTFIEYLERHDSLTAEAGRSLEHQPDTESAAVTIMTIHKAKGLDFPVVVLPQLVADEWQPSARTHDVLEHVLDDGAPTDHDFVERDAREARRLFHVGITRAEDLVVLSGRHPDDTDSTGDPETVPPALIESMLPETVPWSVSGVEFPIWETIQESLPPTAADGTDTLATPVDVTTRVAALDGESTLDRPTARRHVFEQAARMLDRNLPERATAESGLSVDALGSIPEVQPHRRHSYTSLDTFETCTRQHYLDHVVRAFVDPVRDATGQTGPSPREVGIVFHETTERAATQGLESMADWKGTAARIARARGFHDTYDAVCECIDRFFECEARGWDVVAAERRFELSIDGHHVVGSIDALCRHPDGDIVVLDYKTSNRFIDLETNLQLPVYLLACDSLVAEPVRSAGFVYVGPVGPEVHLRTFDDEEVETARGRISELVGQAERSSYADYTADAHCEYCPHNSLPCSEY